MSARVKHSARYVATRTALAVFLGYLFASSGGLVFGLALPTDKMTGLMAGTMATFFIWGLSIMWAFSVKQTRTVCLGLGGGIVASSVIASAMILAR